MNKDNEYKCIVSIINFLTNSDAEYDTHHENINEIGSLKSMNFTLNKYHTEMVPFTERLNIKYHIELHPLWYDSPMEFFRDRERRTKFFNQVLVHNLLS
jgi:hypothetical protein